MPAKAGRRATLRLPFVSLTVGIWLLLETALCLWVIASGETCAFDWDAYMEQVQRMLPAATARDGDSVGSISGAIALNFDYDTLRGDTGPLVYPALHTWIHAGLSVVTAWDARHWTTETTLKNITGYEERTHRPHAVIVRIQYGYLLLHLSTLVVAVLILSESRVMVRSSTAYSAPLSGDSLAACVDAVLTCLLLSLSRRVRNTSIAGFFNDTFSMLLAHLAVFAFTRRRWMLGSVLFSAGVAVKMNVLLFAPGLLYCLLAEGGVAFAAWHIAACALVQLVVALPFLLAAPRAYLSRAFDLGRRFEQQWSVNFNFLPASVFGSRLWAAALLLAHLAALALLARLVWGARPARAAALPVAAATSDDLTALAAADREDGGGDGGGKAPLGLRGRHAAAALHLPSPPLLPVDEEAGKATASASSAPLRHLFLAMPEALRGHSAGALLPQDIAFILYSANLAGVVFARSLHFQFLIWIFHSLPLLLRRTRWPWAAQLAFVALLELVWGNHPPQPWSSACVCALHALLLGAALHGSVAVAPPSVAKLRLPMQALPRAAALLRTAALYRPQYD